MTVSLLSLVLLGTAQAQAQTPPGFDPFTCKDKFGRTINYYLSPPVAGKRLPLAVLVLGSGGQSIWPVINGKVYGGLQNLFLSRVKDHMRVLIVEKPGVQFGFSPPRPGSAEGCSESFLKEHTLDRWTEANNAALNASIKFPGIDPKRVLAVGHSEGGIVVASLAARNKNVTDVACLAGGGPKQSEDLKVLFGKAEIEKLLVQISRDPKSTTKFALGHPHLRWSTFMATSTIEQALKSKARFFIGQGTKDTSVDPAGADQLDAALRAKNRDVTLVKVKDADHGFSTDRSDQTGKGLSQIFDQILTWFNKK